MHTELALGLRARIAVARAGLAGRGPDHELDKATQAQQFHASVRVAFPALSLAESAQLRRRHLGAMRQARLINAHLATLPAAALARFVARHVQIDGQQVLDSVRDDKGPVIFVTPHYGSFALGCLKLIQHIGQHKTVNSFYDPPAKNPSSAGFEALLKGLGYGFNALFNDSTAVLKALRVLKRGEALTMMPDVFDMAGHVLYVPFFGRLVPAMAGTALFALKSQARVIVGFSCPGAGLQTTVKLGQPLAYLRTGNLEADIASLTAAIFQEIEAQIRRAPEHWFYLPGIGQLLGGQMAVGANRQPADWLQALSTVAPQCDAEWPALGKIVNAALAMQSGREPGPAPAAA